MLPDLANHRRVLTVVAFVPTQQVGWTTQLDMRHGVTPHRFGKRPGPCRTRLTTTGGRAL